MASNAFGRKNPSIEWREINDMQYYVATSDFTDSYEASLARCTQLNPESHLAVFSSDNATLHEIAELISDSLLVAGIKRSRKLLNCIIQWHDWLQLKLNNF